MTAIGSEIECSGTGLVYRNPKAHVRSVHAYFPSVALLDNGELLCSLVLGEAFESPDCHTYLARSSDQGESWELLGPIYSGTKDRLTSDGSRITPLSGGEVVAFMVRSDRTDHPDEGLTNPENLGFVPTELLLLLSTDYGNTWTEPAPIDPPLIGPGFELCCPITPLRDGRWIIPTSTWQGWDGYNPNGHMMLALISHDRGATWPEYMQVMRDPQQQVVYWESKVVELADDRLLAVAWAYDRAAAQDQPNQYAISHDGGVSWTAPRSTGLLGQTMTPFVLPDGRILSVYRRIDKPGLWANLSHMEGDAWINDASQGLWGTSALGLTGESENMVENFQVLRFGAPCITALQDGTLFVAFWGYEDCVSNIRWFKLRIK